jgi:hypothetical protein
VAKAVPWDDFTAAVADCIPVYNDRPHSEDDMLGRSPLQVLATAPSRRVLPDNVRPLLLASWQRPVTIGRNGVSIRICGLTVRYGADHPALTALAIGTPVRVSYDPNDIGSVVVWSMDYRMICRAECNQKLDRSLPTEALREQMHKRARQRRTLREANKVGLEHMRDPKEVAIAALNRDSRRTRLPDPPPDGGPALVPVLTPLEVPERHYQKQAVGAEGMDVFRRFNAYANSKPTPGARPGGVAALCQWAKKQAEQ